MQRVSVLDKDGKPLMPTKSSRARRWLRDGKAKIVHNDLNVFCIQLLVEPSGIKIQPRSVRFRPWQKICRCGSTISKVYFVYGSPNSAFS